jgi:hypothetical protein
MPTEADVIAIIGQRQIRVIKAHDAKEVPQLVHRDGQEIEHCLPPPPRSRRRIGVFIWRRVDKPSKAAAVIIQLQRSGAWCRESRMAELASP